MLPLNQTAYGQKQLLTLKGIVSLSIIHYEQQQSITFFALENDVYSRKTK